MIVNIVKVQDDNACIKKIILTAMDLAVCTSRIERVSLPEWKL